MPAYLLPDTDDSLIVVFDLTVSEGHEATSEVTEHPVEQGSVITDHVRQNPQSVTQEMFVTNTPIEDIGRGSIDVLELDLPRYEPPLQPTPGSLFGAIETGIKDLITGGPSPIKVQVLNFGQPFDRIKEIHDQLLDLWNASATMSVVTSVRTYDTMVLTSIGLPRTEKGGATFTLNLKQIRTVTTSTVAAPEAAEKRGAPAQAKGSQSPDPVSGKDAVKASSLLNKALAALGI